MLSQLIGMTMGAYGCVCVGVWSWQPPYSCVRGCQVLHERDPLRVDKSYTAADRLTRGSLAQRGDGAPPSLLDSYSPSPSALCFQ